MAIPSVRMATGTDMPLFGLGTWLSKPGEVEEAVTKALECGYRLIDTAFSYKNEAAVGTAIAPFLADGRIARKDLFITTKLCLCMQRRSDVAKSLNMSLKALGVDYVDLFLIHTPCAVKAKEDGVNWLVDESGKLVPDEVDFVDTWRGMEDAYNSGLAKAIGLSNFNETQIQRIIEECSVTPHNLQVECHVYFPQFQLHAFCVERNISFTAYAPIGSPGRLQLERFAKRAEMDKISSPMQDEIVLKIAETHGKTSAQVLIRWLIDRNISVIPKSVNGGRILENMQVFDFSLTPEQTELLNHLQKGRLFWADL